MAIRTVVTRGYGNGTFSGTIALVTTRGYAIGAAVVVVPSATWTAPARSQDWKAPARSQTWTSPAR